MNGTPVTYDGCGNPLSYRGFTFTWEQKDRLASAVKSGVTTTFAYNSHGQRVRKVSGGTTTKYYYNGSALTGLVKGNNTVQFIYDAYCR